MREEGREESEEAIQKSENEENGRRDEPKAHNYIFCSPTAQYDHNLSAVGLIGLLIHTSDSTIILPSAEASGFSPRK